MSPRRTAAPGPPVADFFVLRAPLLSLETLTRWADGVSAPGACAGVGIDGVGDAEGNRPADDAEGNGPVGDAEGNRPASDAALEQALDRDRALLRARLAVLAADDQVADGLELSSPDLADALTAWRLDPAAAAGRSAERSLVRYVTRVASRPDLYGLAGAYAIGTFAGPARLELAPRARLEVRASVDSGLLREVVRRAAAEAVADDAFLVRRNGGIYRAGGRLRVAARKAGETKHRLVAMRSTPSIELALTTAGDGASIRAIVVALTGAGVPVDHAGRLVRRLIASDMLIAVADVSVTGDDPTAQALDALGTLPAAEHYAVAVERAAAAVSGSPRYGRAAIDAVSDALATTGISPKRRRLLQVDARRPANVRLPGPVLAEMRRTIDLLARITPPQSSALSSFREAFERRYATRSVPLLEALDPDLGIRLGLPDGPPAESGPDPRRAGRRRALLALLENASASPAFAIELSDPDVEDLARRRPARLPGAFAMLASLRAYDADEVADGEFRLVEPTLSGPSGARLLGRLCRGDPELEGHVREHLRREAELAPGLIFAELSVAPETEAGLNITQRPVLRDWEIEYGGGSGADPARRIPPADLLVCVEDDEVVIRLAADGRRVIPGSSTAMNSLWVSLPAARFLLSIAHQRTTGYLGWSWDELADAPALPRVTRGRTILALRRWNVTAAELDAVAPGTDPAGFRRLTHWRRRRDLPRLVSFDHPRNRLLVDFDNLLSVDAFLAATRGLELIRFVEPPTADASPVEGPDGHYAHELIVPFTLAPTPDRPVGQPQTPAPVSESRRRFAPGSEWLFANLYGPPASADRVLVDAVGPLRRRLAQAGLIDRWFFIRYADPARHLRVRFHGRPADLTASVLPALHEACATALADGLLYRISIDTYEREVERYGGIHGVELMEAAAQLDSEAVIEILAHPLSPVDRRRLAVASLAGLYADSGLTIEARRDCCARLRKSWTPAGAGSLGALLGAGERAERAAVAATLAVLDGSDPGQPATVDPRIVALRGRSVGLEPVLARIRALEADGVLERQFDDVLCALAHMSVNRLLQRGANHDELRIHDALARLYDAQIGRERAALRSAVGDGR